VIVAPGARLVVSVSLQLTGVPLILNSTPTIVPPGVAAVPWFLTVAEKVTLSPGWGELGDQLALVTIRSGCPLPTVTVALAGLDVPPGPVQVME